MSSLSHHGIKGQKWGVRRFQNKDGTRTSAGKKQDKASRLKRQNKEVREIDKTLSDDDFRLLGYDKDTVAYKRANDFPGYEQAHLGIEHRVIKKDKNGTPVSVVEAERRYGDDIETGKGLVKYLSVNVATRGDGDYRGKGYAVSAGKQMVRWFDRYGSKEYDHMEWWALKENVASRKTAEKLGFKQINNPKIDDEWTGYSYRKAKHTSIGGTMYIEGNALILGDSSYLEHHGILGQKWGVRRFQNEDGTRTAAGKAREDRRVLKKGTTVKRTSYGMHDETYDNKKYVSTNDDDAGKWSRYIGEARASRGAVVFENEYKLTRDVAVATGKDICKIIDSEFKNADVTKLKEDTDYAARALRQDLNNMSREERVSLNFAMQTQSGKKIVKLLKKHGYDALEDDHGKNVSKDPVIILDPEKNMKRTRVTGNARYYFDYINHTSIDDSPHLSHHGIKGQRWGVRRFQNKDGTRTAAGKKRDTENLKSSQEAKNVNSKIHSYINKQLSSEDLDTGKSNYDFASHLIKDPDFEKVIMPVVQDIRQTKAKYGNKEPYEFTGDEHQAYMNDISRIDNKTGELAITIGLAEKGESHKKSTPPEGEYERVDMFRYALARYLDEHSPDGYSDEGDWIYHSSMEGTLFIEDGTLYLSHHGIRGQRWGVRRFQNRDGSLTNAGRKRLGYATKGATQAVKKAFNAGVKTGAKAVKAAKAHHEKAEAKKIEKKKEKASKTRAGVSANKDLFTAKELKELNAKFEEQDKLTMARIKHGVEIAKAVGETAKSVGEVGKAYEALTGHKLVPDIVTLQNGGSIDFNNKDKGKDTDKDTDKGKDKAKDKDDDPPSNQPPGKGSNWTNTPPDLPTPQSKSKWGVRKKDSDGDSDLQSQMEAVKKQASKAMKNAKLQEYIDAYNRDQNSEKNRELTSRGQKAIELLSKGGGFTSEEPKPSAPSTPKSVPSSNNLMAQIRAAQTKLEKPNKNETPAEHKEAQKKLNALEKAANEYKAAVNKPGIDSAEVAEKLLKKNKDILDSIKHMDFGDDVYLEHHGVRGMKWGKHLMAGKGGGLYDGTALGGGGGGAMTEEERKKAEELRKKKLEEAKKKAEEAAKEKGIEEKAKEIGISAKAYKRYSIDNNHLPGKRHYDKSQKLHGEASSSVAEAQAAERQAHMNRAKAASLNRKVNSSHMFDADGYHISQQRGDDRKEAKRLRKEAKQLDAKSKKALKKFYKKRYKADKERQKWQNSTSGKYHHLMRHYEIQNGILFVDSSAYLSHHGVKGQRWGVRRFQNEDGSLTPKGRKHYEKKIEKLKRKQVSSDAIRGTLERQHPFAVAASVALGATYAAMLGVASAAAPGAVVAGAAIAAAISGVGTHGLYSVSEAWEGRGTRMRSKKIAKYENMLKQSDKEEGMYHVENGTLFINAGEPYLEHHGVKGMKWGKHLMAGKGESGAGGGSGEDDEKLKEMAKKAGMSVAEFRTKMASKLSGAASKVSVKDKHLVVNGTRSLAVGETGEKPRSFKEKAYNALGGKYKTQATEAHREMVQKRNDADDKARRANAQGRAANANKRAGNVREYMANKEGARQLDAEAKGARVSQWEATKKANRAQWRYDHSIAGLYDKATGKYKQAHKKTAIPKMMDRWKYELKAGPNSKLFNNGKGKAKTAKEQAKAEVWTAADHQIKAKEHNDLANSLGGDTNYVGQMLKKEAAKEARLAEGSYRRAAALGKQASSSTSTSSRPRARKKKHTSGGSGVTVRRPGRKPVSRTKRVTQSSTGVKRRSATGTGAKVRRGA